MRLTFVNIKIYIVPFKNQAENTVISPNSPKVYVELRANRPNCAFPQKFHTRKIDEISIF